MKPDRLALDRATVRTSSADGYLHVEISPISKANVCPYYGREIPNGESLGLHPEQVYQLLRDPVELAKAAPTFNNIPLLNQHIPVSALAPPKDCIVGSTGTDAVFNQPYLTNSLVIWDASSIAGIETGEQRELSASYRYVADMTPGEFDGVAYDGRMTEIVGNHVALVETGRCGADVVVGDSIPTEFKSMKLSKKSVAMRAALGAYLRPLLAQDAAIPTRTIVKRDATPDRIAADAKAAFKQADIDVATLTALLTLAADEAEESEMDDDDDDKKKKAKDEGETEEEKKAREDKEAKDEDEDEDNKKANDAAIKHASDAAYTRAMGDFKALREAEKAVHPLVGEVVAMDSAEDVYRFALDSVGVASKGVHASALPAMVQMAKDRHAAQSSVPSRVAMDSAASEDFSKRFPTASKLARA